MATNAEGGQALRFCMRGLMSVDMTALVITGLPGPDGCFDPPKFPAPPGTTYQWVNTTLMGEPDLKRLYDRLYNGWSFVVPSAHPEALAMTMRHAVRSQGFCLMERPTALIEEQRAIERAPHMDLDIRALSILERYTGDASQVSVQGQSLRVSIRKRTKDGVVARPLNTLDEVRAELAVHFDPADVRLFMKRHFGTVEGH